WRQRDALQSSVWDAQPDNPSVLDIVTPAHLLESHPTLRILTCPAGAVRSTQTGTRLAVASVALFARLLMSGHTRWCQSRCGVVARWRCQIGTVESNGGTYTAAFPSAPGGLAQRLVRRYEDAPGAGRTPDTQLDCRGSPLTPANLAAA